MLVVGVDGCRAGWIAVELDPRNGAWRAQVHRDFGAVLGAYPDAAALGIDVPIGLPAEGERDCDRLARALLGPRRSSVFPPPSRRLLALIDGVSDLRAANRICRAALGHGIGAQAFNIHPKIREVDALMTPELQRRVREVHPELCFRAMRGGTPCAFPKRIPDGAAERVEALRLADVPPPPPGATQDDLLDALAAAWTATRIARGEAESLPPDPPLDPRGLRMEMVW